MISKWLVCAALTIFVSSTVKAAPPKGSASRRARLSKRSCRRVPLSKRPHSMSNSRTSLRAPPVVKTKRQTTRRTSNMRKKRGALQKMAAGIEDSAAPRTNDTGAAKQAERCPVELGGDPSRRMSDKVLLGVATVAGLAGAGLFAAADVIGFLPLDLLVGFFGTGAAAALMHIDSVDG